MSQELSTLPLPGNESMQERIARLDRMQAIAGNSLAPELVCEYVAEHGKLNGLADMWGVKSLQLGGWIKKNFPDQYKAAIDEFIMKKVFELSNANMADCFENGVMKPMEQWPDECKIALQSVELGQVETPDGEMLSFVKKFSLIDKMKAIELIGKRHALFVEVHELSGKGGGPIQVITGVPQPKTIDITPEPEVPSGG